MPHNEKFVFFGWRHTEAFFAALILRSPDKKRRRSALPFFVWSVIVFKSTIAVVDVANVIYSQQCTFVACRKPGYTVCVGVVVSRISYSIAHSVGVIFVKGCRKKSRAIIDNGFREADGEK